MDPRIFLAIDNCFALKRWTEPSEWMHVINDLGLKYIECVTDIDNEPLLMDSGYRREWVDEVCNLQAKTGSKVVMMYSGNSTYDTTGLAHPDARVRDYMINGWFEKFTDMAAAIGADIGYFTHGFPEKILYDRVAFKHAYGDMVNSLIRINRMAANKGIGKVALEQMYTPHQSPFTIKGVMDLMKLVYEKSGKELYFTEDIGHHCGDYQRPTIMQLNNAFRRFRQDGYVEVWLGSKAAIKLFMNARPAEDGNLPVNVMKSIVADMVENAHMFSSAEDTDCYCWLKKMAGYSPVIHLQQTDGSSSSHKPFTVKNNSNGIIHPLKILEAIKHNYDSPEEPGMFSRVGDLYLTFEVYIQTRQIGYQALYDLQRSVEYFRKYIPVDGMRLSELLSKHRLEGRNENKKIYGEYEEQASILML